MLWLGRGALGKIRRLGVFTHRSTRQLHRARDGEQSFAGAMAASYLLIEFQMPGAVIQTSLPVRGAAWKRPGALRWQNAVGALNTGQSLQASTCAGKPALDRLAHVGQQMPSVRHLNRSGRPDRDAAGILARPVAGDNLDPGLLPQPVGQCCRTALRQQVNNTMPLQVNDNRAVAAPFALRPIINADNTGRWLIRQRHCLDQPQDGIGTHWHGQTGEQACAGFAAQCQTRLPLRRRQPARASGKGHGQLRQALHKGLASAVGVAAIEAANPQMHRDRTSQ
jgi:hypothetical protein